MDSRNLEKAMDIISALLINEEIHRDRGANRGLYEEYLSNAEVYDMVHLMAGKMNLCLYEYQGGIYVTVYASALGVDVDSLLVSQPDTGEQALEITEALVRSNACLLYTSRCV